MANFNRRNTRLNISELYCGGNWYFITICTQEKKLLLGKIVDGYMHLNPFGEIIDSKLKGLKNHYDLEIDISTIMPNHLHFIVRVGKMTNLSTVIQGFKSFTYKEIKQYVAENSAPNSQNKSLSSWRPEVSATEYLIDTYNTIWQKSFYDHIIRSEQDLKRIREYISNNPLQWNLDELNTINTI